MAMAMAVTGFVDSADTLRNLFGRTIVLGAMFKKTAGEKLPFVAEP
jgi:hypothetical protein